MSSVLVICKAAQLVVGPRGDGQPCQGQAMQGMAVIEDGTLLIRDNRIAWLGAMCGRFFR